MRHLLFFGLLLGFAGCSDSSPPTWSPDAELRTATVQARMVELQWPGAADDTGVKEYELLQDGQRIAAVDGSTRSHRVEGLADEQSYQFSIVAIDEATNRSEPLHLRVTTEDGTAPHWAPGATLQVSVGEATEGEPVPVTLSWAPATDNVGVETYRIYRGRSQLGETQEPRFETTGDPASLRVVAVDEAGNASGALTVRPAGDAPEEITEAPAAEQLQLEIAPAGALPPAQLAVPPNLDLQQPIIAPEALEALGRARVMPQLQLDQLQLQRLREGAE